MSEPQQAGGNIAEDYEQALAHFRDDRYVLHLYVTGSTPQSLRAVATIKDICEEHLKGRYDLEVIDIYQQPELAGREQLLVAPTLLKKMPLPLRRLVGDMSKRGRVLVALDLIPNEALPGKAPAEFNPKNLP